MRKINAVITMLIMVLFVEHAAVGSLIMAGLLPGGNPVQRVLAYVMLLLILIHVIIGIKLTADTLIACRRAGISYFKENKLFWARRLSGFAIMVPMVFHVLLFMGHSTGGAFRLNNYDTLMFIMQLLMVAALAVHIITNVRPQIIAFGIGRMRKYVFDILIILSVLLIFMAASFVIYYVRWR